MTTLVTYTSSSLHNCPLSLETHNHKSRINKQDPNNEDLKINEPFIAVP